MTTDKTPPRDPRPPAGVDPSVPNVARIQDWFLGGKDNFEADRERGRLIEEQLPDARILVEANRQFLDYAVRLAAGYGVRQFLDIGSGLPTGNNTHQIARQVAPHSARVIYVDIDPVVVAHARALLVPDGYTGTGHLASGVGVLELDAADPAAILAAATGAAPGLADGLHLDLTQPVAVIMTCLLHFVDTDPQMIAAHYRDALAPGSMLIITHATGDDAARAAARQLYRDANQSSQPRTPDMIEKIFTGWVLEPPGLVRVEHFTLSGEPPEVGTIPAPRSPAAGGREVPLAWLAGGIAVKP